MRNVLIDNRMNGFSINEATNVVLGSTLNQDPTEVRKRVYRSIYRLLNNGWLSSEGKGRQKKYFQTEKLRSYIYSKEEVDGCDEVKLYNELVSHCNSLEIALGEVEEFSKLKSRFPRLSSRLVSLQLQNRSQLISLMGKINVLTKVLNLHRQK